jgi:hypothetical protein
MGHEKCVELLLKAGADPNLEGEDGIPLNVTPPTSDSIQNLLRNWQHLRSTSPNPYGSSPIFGVLSSSPPATSLLIAPVPNRVGSRTKHSSVTPQIGNFLGVAPNMQGPTSPRQRYDLLTKTKSSPLIEYKLPPTESKKEIVMSTSLQDSVSLNDISLSPRLSTSPFSSSAPITIKESPASPRSPRAASTSQRWSPGNVVKSASSETIQENEVLPNVEFTEKLQKRFSLAELRRNTMSGDVTPIKPQLLEAASFKSPVSTTPNSTTSAQSSRSSTPNIISSEVGTPTMFGNRKFWFISYVLDIGAELSMNPHNITIKTRAESGKGVSKSRKGSKRMSIHQTGGTFKEEQLKLLVCLASADLLKYLTSPPRIVPSEFNPVDINVNFQPFRTN